MEESTRHVRVVFNGATIADTRRAKRMLETSGAPVYFVPAEDVRMEALTPTARRTCCEWKGTAGYFTVAVGDRSAPHAAWSYPHPTPPFAAIAGHVAFYPGKMDACLIDGERVTPQPGGFYGGWITKEIIGPFKGAPGTEGW